MIDYVIRGEDLVRLDGKTVFTNAEIVAAINRCNEAFMKLRHCALELDINVFEALGIRNLSGFVGEHLCRCLAEISQGRLHCNPYQGGYPDLLMTDTQEKLAYFRSHVFSKKGRLIPINNAMFMPYRHSGIAVKATCGATVSASRAAKPLMGEQRIMRLTTFDWKAHDRQTNNLLGVLWDFIDETPTIVACFYQDRLTTADWSSTGRANSHRSRMMTVSVMSSTGIRKMCINWVAVINDPKYIGLLSAKKWIGYRVDIPRLF